MTANGTVPAIRLDRYLALLALLLLIVLGFVVVDERQKAAMPSPSVTGALPPPPDARLADLSRERDELVTDAARLATGLEEARKALATTEAEIAQLNEKVAQLASNLATETEARTALERRLATVEAERDRLSAEVRSLDQSKKELEAEIEALLATPPPAAGDEEPPGTTEPSAPAGMAGPVEAAPTPAEAETSESGLEEQEGAAGSSTEPVAPPAKTSRPRRLTFFDDKGTSVADGVRAYRFGEYAKASSIWRPLAEKGDARAQFYLGSMLFEGRSGPADLVMAYVWLSRAVEGGHLPAIEVRRRVRSAMSEAQYEKALAILRAD